MEIEHFYQELLGVKSPWYVSRVQLDKAQSRVDIYLSHFEGACFKCPCCQCELKVYDHQKERVWRHLDSCQYATYVHARIPRLDCNGKIRQIESPWAEKHSRFTLLMEGYCLRVLDEIDVQGATRLLNIAWHPLWHLLKRAVARGQKRKGLQLPEFIGIDEKSFKKRHIYKTIVCDLRKGVVEWIGDAREQATLERYFSQFDQECLGEVSAIALDMWDPYIAAIRAKIPDADQKMVFDRFHVMQLMLKAVDAVRKEEHRELRKIGDRTLFNARYLLLQNKENIPDWRVDEFDTLRNSNLRTGRAWSIKEVFRLFWNYSYAGNADKYFKRWYAWARRSRLGPIAKAAGTIKNYYYGIRNFFKYRITNAMSESINSKIETIKKMACGYRNSENYETIIYFRCGGLNCLPSGEWWPAPQDIVGTH